MAVRGSRPVRVAHPPSVSPEPEHLKPALERVQTELDARLAEACTEHAADESTGELIRLEELLTDAAQAAKEAISIRRRLGVERERGTTAGLVDAGSEESAGGVRDFVDATGRAWHVWEVPPEQLSARSRPGAYAGEYEAGWLAFESVDGAERRRLPNYPRSWRELGAEGIEALCRDARLVTRRRRRDPGGAAGEASEGERGDPPAA